MEQNAKNLEKSGAKSMKCIDKTCHKHYNRITVLACDMNITMDMQPQTHQMEEGNAVALYQKAVSVDQ